MKAAEPPPVPVINGKKTFIPLENNPESLTTLAQSLGADKALSFHDVYSLTDPDLLAFVPRPVVALIITVAAGVYHLTRAEDPATPSSAPAYNGSGPDEPVMWIKQTIGHACGSMALIHALGNGPPKKHLAPNSVLGDLLKKAIELAPGPRAQLLYDSQPLEKAHMSAAWAGDSRPPAPEEGNDQHFIAFVKGDNGKLWELDGGWAGPIERGTLSEDEDVLSQKAVELGPGRFIEMGKKVGIIEFSVVAMVEELHGST